MKKDAKKTSMKKRGTSWLTKYQPRALAINRQAPGLGRSLKTKLETTFFYVATASAAGIWTGYLNVGSCFDPTGSVSTIQPVGFDQLKALYGRYLVTGGYVEIEASPAAGDYPWVLSMSPSTLATTYASYHAAACQPYSKDMMIGVNESKKMRIYFNTQKIIGSRLPVIAEDCGALISADPATGQNVIMNLYAQCGLAHAGVIGLTFKIVQDVIFDQRIQVVDA